MLLAIPVEASFTETGSRRNDCGISTRIRFAGVQGEKVLRLKFRNAVGVGFKVVDQTDRRSGEFRFDHICLHNPTEVGKFRSPVLHRSRNPEACAFRRSS
jgi:hypothetical protein